MKVGMAWCHLHCRSGSEQALHRAQACPSSSLLGGIGQNNRLHVLLNWPFLEYSVGPYLASQGASLHGCRPALCRPHDLASCSRHAGARENPSRSIPNSHAPQP